MRRHHATTTMAETSVEVVAGFDRRLGDYFLQVSDEAGSLLYTSLQDPQLDWYDIGTLLTKVRELGLVLPPSLMDAVAADGRQRAGNRIVRHHADGPPTTLLAG